MLHAYAYKEANPNIIIISHEKKPKINPFFVCIHITAYLQSNKTMITFRNPKNYSAFNTFPLLWTHLHSWLFGFLRLEPKCTYRKRYKINETKYGKQCIEQVEPALVYVVC